jgi:2-polyprenyl-6-methoxyphenol hydroxylase-like FAD-dependent oxidoreductase
VLGAQLASADSLDAALTRYQQVWQPVIAEKQRIARRGAKWFLPSSSPQRWLRRAVLNLADLPGVEPSTPEHHPAVLSGLLLLRASGAASTTQRHAGF